MQKNRMSYTFRIALAVFMPLTALISCGNDGSSSVPCTGVTSCKQGPHVPVCADTSTTACHGTLKVCVYRLKNSAACECVEGTIQMCPDDDTMIQTCTAVSTTSTRWSDCAAL
jgi:hypothetical protein